MYVVDSLKDIIMLDPQVVSQAFATYEWVEKLMNEVVDDFAEVSEIEPKFLYAGDFTMEHIVIETRSEKVKIPFAVVAMPRGERKEEMRKIIHGAV